MKFNSILKNTLIILALVFIAGIVSMSPVRTERVSAADPSTPNSTCVASCDNSTTVTCAPSTTICSADKSTTICADQSIKPVPCTPSGGSGVNDFDKLKNPLGDNGIGSLTDFIAKILNIIIMIGIPIIVLALIWAGFKYVIAQGDPAKLKTAHSILLWTIVGAALLLGAGAISNAIKDTVMQIGQSGIQ